MQEEKLIYAINKLNTLTNVNKSFSLITNGYLLGDNLIDTLKEADKFSVQITLDGYGEMHDKSRPLQDGTPTFRQIYKNIRRLCEEKIDVAVRINVVVDKMEYYYTMIDKLEADGMHELVHNLSFATIFDGQTKQNCNHEKENGEICRLNKYAREKGFQVSYDLIAGPCMTHRESGFAIDENLKIYNFMQYLMLVIIYPLSYLVISVVSGDGTQNIYYITGVFTSIFLSLFINMEAVQIANQNSIEMAEVYAVYNVSRIEVFWGQCLFHMMLLMPIFLLDVIALLCMGAELHLLRLSIYIILSFFFMSLLSMTIGSLIKNPQIASAMINMIYMIIVMITPIYNNVLSMSETSKIIYSMNPFTHMCSLYYWALGLEVIVSAVVSVLYMVVLGLLLFVYVSKCWKNRGAVEKLNIW